MEFWGDPALAGETAVRGNLDKRSFTAFWHEAGRATAVLNMHVHHAHSHHDHDTTSGGHASGHVDPDVVERLIRSGVPVRIDSLTDPGVPLDALVADAGKTRRRPRPGST